MASLDLPLLTFSGDFQAGVSTVNNDVRHFDNASFEARFQEPRDGAIRNGWWNPAGGSNFSLVGCRVRSVIGIAPPDGTPDPVLTCVVTGPEGRSTGKLIDLDPQWQGSSEIFGMRLRIVEPASGAVWMEARLRTTAFRDLIVRQTGTTVNGQARGANWTSTLGEIRWGAGAASSPMLGALQASGPELFVRLTGFGYHYNHVNGRFAMGRLLGVIGAREPGEPRTCVVRRRLAPAVMPGLGPVDFGLDVTRKLAVMDFGNAIPLADEMGTARDVGPLQLAILGSEAFQPGHVLHAPEAIVPLGVIPYRNADWLMATSGIHVQTLSPSQLARAAGLPLALVRPGGDGSYAVRTRENAQGLVARADELVLRMDGDDRAFVSFYVRQFEQPVDQAEIRCELAQPDNESGGSGPAPSQPTAPIPWTGLPRDAITFARLVATGSSGSAELAIKSTNLTNPRGYLDGQIFAITATLAVGGQTQVDDDAGQINIHLREEIAMPERPEWYRDIRPVLRQYANLYPIMSRNIVDLGDYDDVVRHKRILLFAFTRDFDDPAYMPASRDLSKSRAQLIVEWLRAEAPYKAAQEVMRESALEEGAEAVTPLKKTMMREPGPGELSGPRRKNPFHAFLPEVEE